MRLRLTTSGELNVYDSVVVGDFKVASSFAKTVKGELTKPIRGFKIREARFTWYDYKDFVGNFTGIIGPKDGTIRLKERGDVKITGPLESPIGEEIHIEGTFVPTPRLVCSHEKAVIISNDNLLDEQYIYWVALSRFNPERLSLS